MAPKTEWIEIGLEVPVSDADAIANFLIEQGSNGIVEESPPKIPGLKAQRTRVLLKAYVKNDEHLVAILDRLKKYLNSLYGLGNTRSAWWTKELQNEDWTEKWKSFFQPQKVGQKIVIKPSWRNYWQKHGEIIVEIDPGMAFGTGTHPTTRLCLQAIEELIENTPSNSDRSLLDVGTGSGILAITATLLGARHVVGIDLDPQAIRCAQKNAKLNGISDRAFFGVIPLQNITGSFTVVAANILPQILIGIRKDLISHLCPGGYLILSGILKEKAGEVHKGFKKKLSFIKKTTEAEWSCLIYQKI